MALDPLGNEEIEVLDVGMEDARETYHEDLYRALTGRSLSASLVQDVQGHARDIEAWLEGDNFDADSLPDDAISRVALGEAAKMFGDGVEIDFSEPEEDRRRSVFSRLRTALSRTREPSQEEIEQRKFQALITHVNQQIADEKRAAEASGDDICAAERVLYCRLAEELMEVNRHQAALECMETSRQLGRVVALSQDAAEDDQAPVDPRDAVDRAQDQVSGDLGLDYENLQRDVQALARRRDALQSCAAKPAFADLADDFAAAFDAANDLYATAEECSRPDDAFFEVTRENRQTFEVAVTALSDAAEAFDTAEQVLTEALATRHKAKFKEFGALCETSGGAVTRTGGDLVGGGTVSAKRKYARVPTEVLGAIANKLDALGALSAGGQLDPVHAELAEAWETELSDEIAGVQNNLDHYNDASKKIAKLRKALSTETVQCDMDRRNALSEALDDIESAVAEDVANALVDLAALEQRLEAEMPEFEQAKTELGAFLSDHKDLRGNEIKRYGKKLKRLVKAYEALAEERLVTGDERIHRSALQVLRRVVNYEGKHALEHILIPERMDAGIPSEVETARQQLAALKARIETDTRDILAMQEDLDQLGPDDELMMDAGFMTYVDDLRSSGREISGRAELQATYKEEYAALKAFIKETKTTLEALAQEAFANYAVLLTSLHKRTKSLGTVAEWQDFLTDFRAFRETVEAYATNNRKAGTDEDEDATARSQAVRALETCQDRLDHFQNDMANFVGEPVQTVFQALEIEIAKLADGGPERAEMEAINGIIENKRNTLDGFATSIGTAVDGAELTDISERLGACDQDQLIEVREEALRALRRRRNFLDTAASARLYRDNPFDSGGPALAAIAALSKAEAKLFALIKPT